MNKIEQAESILKKYNQNHIKIKTEEQAEQILEIDFAQLEELYQYAINKKNIDDIGNIEPIKAINPDKLKKEELNAYESLGEEEIKKGKFAVAIMAGGQGTRLGHNGPKGTFKLEINS